MKRLLAGLCFAALLLAIVAVGSGIFRAPWAVPFAQGEALSAVASLDALADRREPELRIWVEDGGTGNVNGYVVRRDATTHYVLVHDGSTVEVVDGRRQVRTASAPQALSLLGDLQKLDGQDWECPAPMDSAIFLVEGVTPPRRFAFSVYSPEHCSDRRSALVVRTIREVDRVLAGGGEP